MQWTAWTNSWFVRGLATAVALWGGTLAVASPPVVPGTGQKLTQVCDTFEDANWDWVPNLPKSSSNLDSREQFPLGGSNNGLWIESPLRGEPDMVRRVATPPGGLPGSKGALLMRTLHSGSPEMRSFKMQQDDLLSNSNALLGAPLPAGWSPNFLVRVYLPPWDQWEKRSGTSFGFRADCLAYTMKTHGKLFFKHQRRELESYWPGMFIQFNSKADGNAYDSATILVRGDDNGHDIPKVQIKEPGWWTLGMSITPDGRVHYYASPGVDPLTYRDHIATMLPYGFACETFGTFFFNISNMDDGSTWSTPWIIDDPELYVIRGY